MLFFLFQNFFEFILYLFFRASLSFRFLFLERVAKVGSFSVFANFFKEILSALQFDICHKIAKSDIN
jgi:hypothetical protein